MTSSYKGQNVYVITNGQQGVCISAWGYGNMQPHTIWNTRLQNIVHGLL